MPSTETATMPICTAKPVVWFCGAGTLRNDAVVPLISTQERVTPLLLNTSA